MELKIPHQALGRCRCGRCHTINEAFALNASSADELERNYTCAMCSAVVAYEGELPDDCLRCGAPQ